MNRTYLSSINRRFAYPLVFAALAAIASGCAKDRMFTINGQVVTKDEYIKALERQNVVAAGGTQTTAMRAALDLLVGNQIILAEAANDKVMPGKDEVIKYYNTQKRLFEASSPGKDYEKAMSEAGTSPEEVQAQMTVQLAESAVYAHRLNITEGDIRNAYNIASQRGGVGLPKRVQLRFVMPTNVGEFQDAQKQLARPNADFNAVAARINPPTLRVQDGLWPQAVPLTNVGPAMAAKFDQTAEGAFFGPIDFQVQKGQRPVKAWVKVEKKLPGLGIPFADANEIVRSQLVQMKLRQPEYQAIRQKLIQEKLDVTFQADPRYMAAWDAMKTSVQQALANQQSLTAAPASASSVLANPGGSVDAATTPLTK